MTSLVVRLIGVLVVVACAAGGAAAIADVELHRPRRSFRSPALLERERDLAANLGWSWRGWVTLRLALLLAALSIGPLTGVWVVALIAVVFSVFGFRFLLAGRAAGRRLRMERAFVARLRELRDRMAVGNQTLDTALLELGRNPGAGLEHVLAPLGRGGSVVDGIVEVGLRARSPIVENACAVLIWTRSRSLDALIAAIDDVLLPVGEAQLAVQEEAAVTLTQQRAVALAMSGLMVVMFAVVIRVDSFRAFYQSLTGTVVLACVVLLFTALVGLLAWIVRVPTWTRWDLRAIAREQERLSAQ